MNQSFNLHPVGRVIISKTTATLEIYPPYEDAMQGLEAYSHIMVLYWLHENDTPELRRTLKVHPRRNPENPLTGVFATRSPMRPNPIAVSTCRILSITGTTIAVAAIDAHNGSPVIDIKGYMPENLPIEDLKLPTWAKR